MVQHNAKKTIHSCHVEGRTLHDEGGEVLFYEHCETIVPLSCFDHAAQYKIACEACHKYGKNFACPPYSPTFSGYLAEQKYAKVVCIRMPQEYFKSSNQEETYRECFRKAGSLLVAELLHYRKQEYLVAGSGYCMACEVCGAEEGLAACPTTGKMIYSLESLGVNLTALTKTCFNFDLEWTGHEQTADFVCSIGAGFWVDESIGPKRY